MIYYQVLLKYIPDSFEKHYLQLKSEVDMGIDPEDREEYKKEKRCKLSQ